MEVSLSAQHMWFYKNGQLLVDTDVVTGNHNLGHDTKTGIYAIMYIERNATLVVEDYSSPVIYWIPFYANVGIHDASWRTTFGVSEYLSNGSHGCVNTPFSAMKTIYENVKIGYPVVLRPAYSLGGSGGCIAENEEEFVEILMNGLSLSRVGQVLVERCIAGWKEIEYEVMRDANGTCITVCNMENLDPVGVHTGDSIVVAPSQTLADKEYQMLRSAALNIITELGIQGGCNVQFALNPDRFEYDVIEINQRVSRSSANKSKATGYPIAKVSAKIALGYTLDEIENAVTKKTKACFEPSVDYVVAKIPKWPFDKFNKAD